MTLEDLLERLRVRAREAGTTPHSNEMVSTAGVLRKRFGLSWAEAVQAAGLEPSKRTRWTQKAIVPRDPHAISYEG